LKKIFSDTVVCRPALPFDTPGVLALTAKIWDGHDYIPQVWDAWLADATLLTVVAEYGGCVAGLYCLAHQGPGEWWLQGLRVDPDFQGRGIASHLHDYLMAYWQRSCDGVIRLGTSTKRLPVHHLCQRSGFNKVGAFRLFSSPAAGGMHAFSRVTEADLPLAAAVARHNPLSELCHGLMDLGWEWADPTQERVADVVRQGRAYWWRKDTASQGLLLLGEDDEGPVLFPVIRLCACPLDVLADLLGEFPVLAAALGYPRAAWVVPSQPRLVTAVQEAGFMQQWEHELFLYAKKHSTDLE
jgi:GNAT superfamily N-acetyltransferase